MTKRLAVLLFFCVAAAGCGSSPIAPSPSTQNFTGTVAAFDTARQTFSVPRAGTMTVTLSWSNVAVDLDLYLVPTSCTALYPQSACGVLASSATANNTKETLTRNVASGENYAIIVDNLSASQGADFSLTVTIQ